MEIFNIINLIRVGVTLMLQALSATPSTPATTPPPAIEERAATTVEEPRQADE